MSWWNRSFYKDKINKKWSNIGVKWEILIFFLNSVENRARMQGLAQPNMPQFMTDP